MNEDVPWAFDALDIKAIRNRGRKHRFPMLYSIVASKKKNSNGGQIRVNENKYAHTKWSDLLTIRSILYYSTQIRMSDLSAQCRPPASSPPAKFKSKVPGDAAERMFGLRWGVTVTSPYKTEDKIGME